MISADPVPVTVLIFKSEDIAILVLGSKVESLFMIFSICLTTILSLAGGLLIRKLILYLYQ